jgi:large subunit ribosomal protein L4
VENEAVFSPEEDERLSFQYNIVPGPKFAPLLKLTAARTFEEAGEIELLESVFGAPVRKDIIHNVVVWQRAKRRQGTSKIKGISEVRGTGKKPFAQKGTGKARQGSLRAPQMRKGADPHGKDNPDYSFKLNKKVRRFGMRSVLSARLFENQVFVVDSFELPPDAAPSLPAERRGAASGDAAAVPKEETQEPVQEQALAPPRWKTKDISALVQKFKWQDVAFIDKYAFTKDFEMATRNVPFTTHFPSVLANVYDLLKCKVLVISKPGLAELTLRLDEQAQKARFYSKRASK